MFCKAVVAHNLLSLQAEWARKMLSAKPDTTRKTVIDTAAIAAQVSRQPYLSESVYYVVL